MDLRDRGVYRHDREDGYVEFYVHDSNRVCIAYCVTLAHHAHGRTEELIRQWLVDENPVAPPDVVDPATFVSLLVA